MSGLTTRPGSGGQDAHGPRWKCPATARAITTHIVSTKAAPATPATQRASEPNHHRPLDIGPDIDLRRSEHWMTCAELRQTSVLPWT